MTEHRKVGHDLHALQVLWPLLLADWAHSEDSEKCRLRHSTASAEILS